VQSRKKGIFEIIVQPVLLGLRLIMINFDAVIVLLRIGALKRQYKEKGAQSK
jgi:hypothetical protein